MELITKHGRPGNDAMREMHGIHGEPTPIIGAHQSHNQHAGHSIAMFRDKFWLSLALTLPVVFWAAGVQRWLGYRAPAFPGSQFVPAILGSVIFSIIMHDQPSSSRSAGKKRCEVECESLKLYQHRRSHTVGGQLETMRVLKPLSNWRWAPIPYG